jgi:hypothetical protein
VWRLRRFELGACLIQQIPNVLLPEPRCTPKLLMLLVCEDRAGVAVVDIRTPACLSAKPTCYSLSHAAPLNYCCSRMGLVWWLRRFELRPALQHSQRATVLSESCNNLNYCCSRMGLVWRVQRFELGPALQQSQRATLCATPHPKLLLLEDGAGVAVRRFELGACRTGSQRAP